MKSTQAHYQQITNTCKDLFINKMKDYGAAWRILGTGQTNARWLQYLEPFGVAAATA